MIRINLLPFRAQRKKENVRRQVSIFLLTAMCATTLLIYHHISLGSKLDTTTQKVTAAKSEHAKYKSINKEIEKLIKELDIINRKVAVIENLEKDREASVKMVDAMTQLIIKEKMCFTGFQSNRGEISISGIAYDNKTVADFMTRIEKSDLFMDVNLKTTKQANVDQENLSLKAFDITFKRIIPTNNDAEAKSDTK
jgi:type IV pilus assembly protein PilN